MPTRLAVKEEVSAPSSPTFLSEGDEANFTDLLFSEDMEMFEPSKAAGFSSAGPQHPLGSPAVSTVSSNDAVQSNALWGRPPPGRFSGRNNFFHQQIPQSPAGCNCCQMRGQAARCAVCTGGSQPTVWRPQSQIPAAF
eukprot:scaffold107106_cov42-Prasinocladus_malaysianus.AAC.1